ncbi:MAG: PD40 domain-containing protein [Anaerolineaceae bacterium]|nr:PD40 domain-containing protein [Anaerolineaceae bacterium]
MKTTRSGIFLIVSLLTIFSMACVIGGTSSAGPTQTPYVITATFESPAEPDIALTQTAEAALVVEPDPHALPAELRLVYTDTSSNLFSWTEADGVNSLLATGDIMGPRLSDDGQWIVFIRTTDYIHYNLWIIGFDGIGERILVSSDQFLSLSNHPDAPGAAPYIYSWVPGSHTLAFNVSPKFEGPGLLINDDLHLVNAESGMLSTLLAPGDGGVFYYSPDGSQIALVTPENISLINADGSNRRDNVLTYDPVLTYSEYMYYAEPKWADDSSFLRVAIPPQDPLGDLTQQTTLWHIPTDGSAAGIAGHVLIAPLTSVNLSPDLSWIAYLDYFGDPSDNRRNLHFNNFSGTADHIYTTGEVRINAWNPDSNHLVYTNYDVENTKYADKDGGETLLIPVGSANSISFINENTYIYLRNAGTEWQLAHGNLDGTQTMIASMPWPGGDRLPNYSFVH